MKKHKIQGEIMKLIYSGETTFENCEKLVLLENALKCLEKYEEELKEYENHERHDKALTKEQVMSWVASMENADGTHGGHWTMEQTERAREGRSISCDPLMFYAAMNMMYSDYCKAAEKANAGSVDLYAYMASAFLKDKDAVNNKISRYYSCIVKH